MMNQLTDSLKTNQIALRYVIQYEVLHKKPIMESYDNFCKMVGKNAMSYPDFEFWYMRFSNGHLDVNYERPEDPLALSKMPVEMVGKIVEKLDPASRIITRYVSKSLRTVVDSLKPNVKVIHHEIRENESSIYLHRHKIVFTSADDECWMEYNNIKIKVEGANHIEEAFRATEGMLAHSELKLDEFMISEGAEISLETVESLITPKKLINANSVIIETANPDVRRHFLKLMMPGTLESISIRDSWSDREYSLGNIMEMEQWKQAKRVTMCSSDFLSHADIRKCHEISNFYYRTRSFELDDLVDLRNTLRSNLNFVNCCISASADGFLSSEDLSNVFGRNIRYDTWFNDPIPDSTDFLKFFFKRGHVFACRERN